MLVKPTDTGLQFGHTLFIYKILDSLKTAVTFEFQDIHSVESVFKKRVFLKSKVKSRTHSTENLESFNYTQGKLYLSCSLLSSSTTTL